MAIDVDDPIKSYVIYPSGRRDKDMTGPSLPPLPPADMQKARELSRALVRSEDQLDDIVTFGSDAQAALAQISKQMLHGVRAATVDDVIALSDGVLVQINSLDLDDLAPAARRYLLILRESAAAIRHRIKKFFASYELVNARLDRVEAEIFSKETAATQRYYADAELGQAAIDIIHDARLKLAAIKLFLGGDYGYVELERRNAVVAQEKAAAAQENRSVDFVTMITAERYARYIERLEMKATSLEALILSAYQSTVSIRMMQDNEVAIQQKLSNIRTEVLPQWRLLISLAYQAYQQRGIAAFVHRINTAQNRLQEQVGDQLPQLAGEIAWLKTQETVDLQTMAAYNEKLIRSLEILKTASLEAKKSRDLAEASVNQLIKDLSDGVASTMLP